VTTEVVVASGKVGAGKDRLAQILRPLGYLQLAFAWPLKLGAIRDVEFTFEEVFHTKPRQVREYLQREGVRMRQIEEDYWVNQLDALFRLHSEIGGHERFIITDCRFPNELEWARRRGAKLIRLEHGDRPYPLAGTPAAEHISEIALDGEQGWDMVLENGTNMTPERTLRLLEAGGIIPDSGLPALALLQEELEREEGAPLARAARLPEEPQTLHGMGVQGVGTLPADAKLVTGPVQDFLNAVLPPPESCGPSGWVAARR